MRGRVHLLLPFLLLTASPAYADFFDDVGNVFDGIGNAVEDVFTEDKKEPAKPAPAPAAPQQQIEWNSAPPDLSEFDKAEPFVKPSDSMLALRRRETAAFAPRGNQADDAPAPRRAPRRGPVLSSYLSPLPGFTEAPARPRPSYSPVMAAAALPRAMVPPPSRLPTAKPAAVVYRGFTVTYASTTLKLEDEMVSSNSKPGPQSRALVEALASNLKGSANRLQLRAEALAQEGRLSEARKRAFDRALMIKGWLIEAGIRPTQIDMQIVGASTQDTITLLPAAP